MAFQQGLSGLASSARALDVISSNVANASTVGYKASNAVFADTFAASMTGAMSSIQIGVGGMVNAVRQNFTQGGVTTTNNSLDMAINGNGFFQIERTNGTTAYSRNGQFDLNKDGYVITPLGERLMGYQTIDPATGSVSLTGSGTPVPLYVPPQGLAAEATTSANIRVNLYSGSAAFDAAATPAPPAFSTADASTYNSMTSINVFDSQGNEHTLAMYFRKTAANEWDVYTSFDGGTPSATPHKLSFNAGGFLNTGATLPFTPPPLTNGASLAPFNVSLAGTSQNSAEFTVYERRQNGFAPGDIAGVSVTSDGILQGRYSNGKTQNLGQVVLATFRNPNGLVSLGNNLWAETTESGLPTVGIPGTGLNGTLASGQVEESNVDMSQELVQMIIQQRNYQANAQSIRTQDQLLQTLINLR